MNEQPSIPGPIALLGSGETSLAGGRILESLAKGLPKPLRIAILETPAGFELNSAQVAGRVADFFRTRLQNYAPVVDVIPARKRGTEFDPDREEILGPLAQADLIFMGPGSPTYAVRQLAGSLAWDLVRLRHRTGAALLFSSAATIAVGRNVLPVYEIYKVGEDVSSPPGLDLFADFGLRLSFVPHWNNAEGGADLDTSRCFIGMDRFAEWCALQPKGYTCLGLDEHTGLVMDFHKCECRVNGVSSVTLLRECDPRIYPSEAVFPMSELGNWQILPSSESGIAERALEMFTQNESLPEAQDDPPEEVRQLAEERQQARERKEWAQADGIRKRIEMLGWQVLDTPEGMRLARNPDARKF
jgi:cyanophycinase-like exopeptidase